MESHSLRVSLLRIYRSLLALSTSRSSTYFSAWIGFVISSSRRSLLISISTCWYFENS